MSERNSEEELRQEAEADFAEEHTRPTYEDEHSDSASAPGDESVPEGPGGETREDPKKPL